MQVKVHYISLVKSYTNTSQDEFTFPNGSLLSVLLDKIAESYGEQFTQEVYDPTQERDESILRSDGKRRIDGPTKRHKHTSKRRRQRHFDVAYDRRLNHSLPLKAKTTYFSMKK